MSEATNTPFGVSIRRLLYGVGGQDRRGYRQGDASGPRHPPGAATPGGRRSFGAPPGRLAEVQRGIRRGNRGRNTGRREPSDRRNRRLRARAKAVRAPYAGFLLSAAVPAIGDYERSSSGDEGPKGGDGDRNSNLDCVGYPLPRLDNPPDFAQSGDRSRLGGPEALGRWRQCRSPGRN